MREGETSRQCNLQAANTRDAQNAASFSLRSGWPAWEGVFGSSSKMADAIGTRGALSKERRVREKPVILC